MSDDPIPELLRRVRAGDQAAAAELVRRYEPEIRRSVRARLTDPRLKRVVDSADVCQSVLANFFVRASAGEYDLQQPEELAALLATMARNKLLDQVRRVKARKRDAGRRDVSVSALADGLADSDAGPATRVENLDLLSAVRRRMTDDERRLAERRAAGMEWAEIAIEEGAQPDALRKKLARALDRILREIGVEELQ